MTVNQGIKKFFLKQIRFLKLPQDATTKIHKYLNIIGRATEFMLLWSSLGVFLPPSFRSFHSWLAGNLNL